VSPLNLFFRARELTTSPDGSLNLLQWFVRKYELWDLVLIETFFKIFALLALNPVMDLIAR